MVVSEGGSLEKHRAWYFHQLAALHFLHLVSADGLISENAIALLGETYGLGVGSLVVAEAKCGRIVVDGV